MYCWGWWLGTAGSGSLAVPPCPCGANPLGCPCSGVAPGASRRAAGGTPPGCRLRRSTARGSGRAPSAGPMGCTRTHAPLCTRTSWWGCLTRKERETPWVGDPKKGGTFPGERAWSYGRFRGWLWGETHAQCSSFRCEERFTGERVYKDIILHVSIRLFSYYCRPKTDMQR